VPKVKQPWHSGTHQTRAAAVVARADADPTTRCWQCGLTLEHCRPHHDGKPARWTAGHVIDGQIGGELKAECSPCNFTRGAAHGNGQRKQATTHTW